MDMLPNVVRIKGISYFIYSGRKYKITKMFLGSNPKRNLQDANAYLGSKNGTEGVIWSRGDDRQIIICRCDDLGQPYTPHARKRKK